jgi:hypothetical protein
MPSDYENDFRKHFEVHYAASGATFEEFRPSYEFGFEMANDPKFKGKKFHDVESEIENAYLHRYPGADLDRNWDALFYGWEKAGGAAGGFGFI